MFAKYSFAASVLSILVASCTPQKSISTEPVKQAQSGANLLKQCEGRDGWSDAAPPAQVFGNVYMVGTCGITALLITTSKGHFLIDGATDKAAKGIADNIRKLGFDPKDVRYLLATHEHLDHSGGLAELKSITGAQFAVREAARIGMESGLPLAEDPQHGLHPAFPGIKAEQIIADNDTLVLANQSITVLATPGHTPGGTSYVWKSCDAKNCRNIVYADSLNAISADEYRFSDHPAYVAMLRKTIDRVGSLADCDIMISPHPFQSDFFERLAGLKPLIDKNMCKNYAAAASEKLTKRLAKEAGQ